MDKIVQISIKFCCIIETVQGIPEGVVIKIDSEHNTGDDQIFEYYSVD